MKVSSLAAPKVVILTTFGAASDEDFIKMKTFSFQCMIDIDIHIILHNKSPMTLQIALTCAKTLYMLTLIALTRVIDNKNNSYILVPI